MKSDGQGRAVIRPDTAFAGEKGKWEIIYTAGREGIKEGGSIRVLTPRGGLVLWQPGKVTAFCSNPNIFLEVQAEKAYPATYHHSNYPAVNVFLYGDSLKENEEIRVVMGSLGGYISGRYIQAQAQKHAGEDRFRVFVDIEGNANFSRESLIPEAYQEIGGDLKITVVPARPERIRFTVRNGSADRRDFTGIISVEDRYENPVEKGEFNITLHKVEGLPEVPPECLKPDGESGMKFSLRCSSPGVCRAAASHWEKSLFGVSNPFSSDFYGDNLRCYFGDMHVMTGSYTTGSMIGTTEGAILYARDVFGLDFTAVTNGHTVESWPKDQKLFSDYNEPHKFVTLPAYEKGFKTGHKNIYYLDEKLPAFYGEKVENLWEFLSGKRAMAISHHTNTHSETSARRRWRPLDISTINPGYEKLIEICQNRGSFEKEEIGGEVSFGGFGSSIRSILSKGYRLGFVGGTDTHRGRPGSPLSNQSGLDAQAYVTGGITGVIAGELTREAIWESLQARRCYAATSCRILLDFRLNEHMMGQDVEVNRENMKNFEVRELEVRAAGTYEISRIVIVRNGKEVYRENIDKMDAAVTWKDSDKFQDAADGNIGGIYYYAKIYQHDGNMAWSSPVWLTMR